MIAQYVALSQRLAHEREELEKTTKIIMQHWTQAGQLPEHRDAFINSTALNLHAFDAGLERLFELIASDIDGGVLGGDAWHTELLGQMALELPGVRPAVLRRETVMSLDEYRKFRHRIWNIYATRLDAGRMTDVVVQLPGVWQTVSEDLGRFQTFLQDLARADEDET